MLVILFLVLCYFLFTPWGRVNVYDFISKKLSQSQGMHIKIESIDLSGYPEHIHSILSIEKKAKLTLDGYVDTSSIDMHYTLKSSCIATKHCKLDDHIQIKGEIKGVFSKLFIRGSGQALDGNISYQGIKYTQKVEDVTLQMHDINATKLAHLLAQEPILKGKADVKVNFSLMSKKQKYGSIIYDVKDENFQGIALALHSHIHIKNNQHTFSIKVNSEDLTLEVQKGHYNQKTKETTAIYTLNIKELSKLKHLLGYAYQGALYARGKLSYKEKLIITGLSKSFGGLLDFVLEDAVLKMKLDKVSLKDILYLFSVPAMLDAQTNGTINYYVKNETLDAHTTLNQAKFLPSTLTKSVKEKAHINMMNETFHDSTLEVSYYDNLLLTNLKLLNARNHFHLTDVSIDTKQKTIHANFDFEIQNQSFSGKIYDSLYDPKVDLNLQKLIRYQMDKQVDKIIGKEGRNIMEHMPMGGAAKDMATDMGASIMKVFF